jgi:putative spermidine/putrescine transport system permease protein
VITSRRSAVGLALPSTALVFIFLILPLLLLFRYSFNRFVPGQFMVEAVTTENYLKFITDPYYVGVLKTTLLVAVAVTTLCLVAGFPVALMLARTVSRHKSALVLAVILPLFVGNAVRAAGWMVALGQHGLVNVTLMSLGLLRRPVDIMYTPTAVIIGILSVNLPFVVLTLQSVLEGIDRAAEEAALSLGATPFQAWQLVTLPLAVPGLLAAGILCFILTMNAYATPVLLGGPRFQMMAPRVADEILNQTNWPFGAALAFVLMVVTLALTAVINVFVASRYAKR